MLGIKGSFCFTVSVVTLFVGFISLFQSAVIVNVVNYIELHLQIWNVGHATCEREVGTFEFGLEFELNLELNFEL